MQKINGLLTLCHRLREDIAKEVGFVETNLSNYTGNQWREFFRMLPSTVESLLRDIAPFLAEAENHEICFQMAQNSCGSCFPKSLCLVEQYPNFW